MSLHKSKRMTRKIATEKQHYSEPFKRMVIQEYLNTGVSKMSLLRKYDIKMKSGIQRWMRQLGYENIRPKTGYLKSSATPVPLAAKKTKQAISNSERKLEDRIKELERLLEDEQLRSEAYQRMIEIAERDLNIPIRKKSDT